MNLFFIGCTHFGHEENERTDGIIKLADRPFSSIEEHDEALIERWNAVVTPRDMVIHLGDFAWRDGVETLRRLNGIIQIVPGNHDYPDDLKDYNLLTGCGISQPIRELEYRKKKIVLCHFPIDDWNKRWHGSIHLHAHTHVKQFHNPNLPYEEQSGLNLKSGYPKKQTCNRFNVGADAINFTPISLDAILAASLI
jgi:calcineurin-like phosphoesterase family protein